MPRSVAVVLGAGVVGLSTAACLQDDGWDVVIVSDRFLEETTSWLAGAGSCFVF